MAGSICGAAKLLFMARSDYVAAYGRDRASQSHSYPQDFVNGESRFINCAIAYPMLCLTNDRVATAARSRHSI